MPATPSQHRLHTGKTDDGDVRLYALLTHAALRNKERLKENITFIQRRFRLLGKEKDTQKGKEKRKQLIENQLCTGREEKKKSRMSGLLERQFSYVHDQPLAVFFMIDWLRLHHRGFDP